VEDELMDLARYRIVALIMPSLSRDPLGNISIINTGFKVDGQGEARKLRTSFLYDEKT
jgi:hypothetical protein